MPADFTIRVVLYSATSADYETLANHMALRGMTDEIRSDDGVVYKLPDAEYSLTGSTLTRSQVHDQAAAAAKATKRQHSIFITESAGRMWSNLPVVSKKARA